MVLFLGGISILLQIDMTIVLLRGNLYRTGLCKVGANCFLNQLSTSERFIDLSIFLAAAKTLFLLEYATGLFKSCLLYTSPSPRDYAASRMPSSA